MSELLLSVSGARGIVGKSMTPRVARRFAAAFGCHLGAAGPPARIRRPQTVVLGRDARPTGGMLVEAAAEGLLATGFEVIEIGIVATPTVSVMVEHLGARGGLVVTASHNPDAYNGLKCLTALGGAPEVDEAMQIIDCYHANTGRDAGPTAPASSAESFAAEDAVGIHLQRVIGEIDGQAIQRKGFCVVLDSVAGGGARSGRRLLEQLGCEVVHLYGEPTGSCPHGLEPREANLGELMARTTDAAADIGFAQDPDADRLAIVDERGRYIGEELTLVLAARRLLERAGGAPVVTNLSTSRLIEDVVAKYPGATVHRTAVGEANVAAGMRRLGAQLGGEGNGGIIVPAVCWVRDSHVAMALILELLAVEGRALSEIVDELPTYVLLKTSYDLGAVGGPDGVTSMIERVRDTLAEYPQDSSDGVRVEFPKGWVHLRPSNTEPIVRLIAEATTENESRRLLALVAEAAGIDAKPS